MDVEELLTDDEMSRVKIACDTVAYQDPKTFDGDRHFVARAVARAQLEKSHRMRQGWVAAALETPEHQKAA